MAGNCDAAPVDEHQEKGTLTGVLELVEGKTFYP